MGLLDLDRKFFFFFPIDSVFSGDQVIRQENSVFINLSPLILLTAPYLIPEFKFSPACETKATVFTMSLV